MKRKLFCEISPATYKISVAKCRFVRHAQNFTNLKNLATQKSAKPLEYTVYKHNSLIRRRLGNVDMQLQENKAINLSLAAPKVNATIILPGQTFSFWHLVGNTTAKNGYKEGLTIKHGQPSSGVGGGMCQFTNLIHWMILHTPLTITERHHHDYADLFPDHNRQIPFGTGTSILYNYLDYRFKNETDITFQLLTYTTEEYLCGEIRANKRPLHTYHVQARGEFFSKEKDGVYRNGKIYRRTVDPRTGNTIKDELLQTNHAKVMYSTAGLDIVDLTASGTKTF